MLKDMFPTLKSKIAVTAGALAAVLLLAGCASFNPLGGSGMMNSSTRYYSPKLRCPVPNNLPGQLVTVALGDMGMSQMMGGVAPRNVRMRLVVLPSKVSAGEVSIAVSNLGWRTHELVVLPLGEGEVAGGRVPNSEGEIDETGSLGEASNTCGEGSGEGIKAGATSWVSLTLKLGRYEFVCNLPNHYADGMWQEVIVTS
ncbi:MAG: hypothetical protein HY050_07240 [Actinobacteria bacterium]|nr:hypothetical protein [Actinomycetota bacterium]